MDRLVRAKRAWFVEECVGRIVRERDGQAIPKLFRVRTGRQMSWDHG